MEIREILLGGFALLVLIVGPFQLYDCVLNGFVPKLKRYRREG